MILNAIKFRAVVLFESAPNEKQTCYIVSCLKNKRKFVPHRKVVKAAKVRKRSKKKRSLPIYLKESLS